VWRHTQKNLKDSSYGKKTQEETSIRTHGEMRVLVESVPENLTLFEI
jgi:hypothetical protein